MVRLLLVLWIAQGLAFAAPEKDPAAAPLEKAAKLEAANDQAGALAEHRRALAIYEKAAKETIATAKMHGRIATNLARLGKIDEAVAAAKQQLAIREKVLGDHADTAASHALLFELYKMKGDAVNALDHAERGVAIREKAGDPLLGESLDALGQVYTALSRPDAAEKVYRRLREVSQGPGQERRLVAARYGMGQVYRLRERHVEAEAELRAAVELLTKLNPKDPGRAELYSNIGDTLIAQSEYEKALVELARALETAKTLAAGAERIATIHGTIGATYTYMGDYPSALRAMEAAREIWREQPVTGLAALIDQNNYGQALSEYGEHGRALVELEAVLPQFKKLLGDRSPDVGTVLLNLSVIHNMLGNSSEGRANARNALAIFEAANPDGATVANAANILGDFEDEAGNAQEAQRLYERAIAINRKLRGNNNRITGESVRSLGLFYLNHGQFDLAEQQLAAAHDAMLRSETPKHRATFETRSLLADVRWKRGNRAEAEALLRSAIAELEASLGPTNVRLVESLNRLSMFLAVAGREQESLAVRARSSAIRNGELALRLSVGSERQKLEAFQLVDSELRTVISHLARYFKTDDAVRLALDLVLRRKGRVLDSMSRHLEAVRERLAPGDRDLLDQLASTRAYLASLTIKGPTGDRAAHDARLADLSKRLEQLEAKLGAIGSTLVDDKTGLDAVQAALPKGTALVELLRYRDTDSTQATIERAIGKPRYVAFVLHARGTPRWVDLGDASAIEGAVAVLRRALADPRSTHVEQAARSLDQLVMRPLRPLLGDVRSIFIAPDGSLNLVPFGALRDEHGRYLVHDYQFTYLDTGRDLVRLGHRAGPRQPPLLIGAPDFGSARQQRTGERSADFAMEFGSLPGTADELADLAKVVRAARTASGSDATERLVKSTAGPEILHIASHGFFLEDEEIRPGSRGLVKVARSKARVVENPLLRSGLALAGANGAGAGGEDGLLTALEVSGLDLRGTRLVVLSACDTGVGDVRNGNGVFGLRRALVTAGAETQVMSLWKVDDRATHELMTAFYSSITSGRGRSEAMRAAQLEISKRPDRAHPYFWASFIVSGNPETLAGETRMLPPAPRGARGCTCASADPGSTLMFVCMLGLLLRRRRGRWFSSSRA